MKIPKFFMRKQRAADAEISSFGPLEREVMMQVWERGEVNVRAVVDGLDGRLAYTTVMTTLDRLFKKGLLERRKDGKAYLYTARYSAEQLETGVAQDVIGSLLDAGTYGAEPVLACIVDAVSDRDSELLDRLEELVREKRRELSDLE